MTDDAPYAALFEEMKWGIGLFDLAGTLTFCSPALPTFLRQPAPSTLTQVLDCLLGKDLGDEAFSRFRQGSTHHLFSCGDLGICRLILKPLRDRIVMIAFPLEHEGERLAINEILADLVEQAPEPVGIAANTSQAVYMNRSARKIMGVASDKHLADLTVPELQPDGIGGMSTEEALALVREFGPINVVSTVKNMTSGELRTVDQTVMTHARPVLGHTYYSTILREKREAADESTEEPAQLRSLVGEQSRMMRENSDKLYYSREIWRSLVEYNHDLVMVTDRQGTILYCNRGFLGDSTLPLIGLSLPDELAPLPLREDITALAGRVASGTCMHDSIEAELVLPDGKRYYCLWLASHLRRQDGNHGITWIITDITREHTIRQRSQAIEKLAATGRMAARIAHEFNNPMAGIKGAIALVKMDTPATSGSYRYLSMVEKEIDRLSGIIRQMYGLYKPESQSVSNICVSTLLSECCFLMQPLGTARGIRIEPVMVPAITVKLPEQYLREIIYNLIRNAVEASYENGVVRVSASVEHDCLHITIEDDGHGLPENPDENVFEPFFTTKKTFQGAGLGLGLSVCKSLADAMGGSVSLRPRNSGGVSALACLPLDAATSHVVCGRG